MVPRLEGTHWRMGFVGCIGLLMESNSLVPWLECAFSDVPKKLVGNKFPMNVRA